MSSSVRRVVLGASAFLAFFGGGARGQSSARLTAHPGDVPPRLAARVAEAVARAWGVDPSGLVLSWGSGTFADLPDSSAFRLLGTGEEGWFAVTIEPAGRTARAARLRAGVAGRRFVAVRALRPGMRLAEGDIRQEPYVRWGPPPAAAEQEPGPGWVVRRIITPGAPLNRTRVAPPPAIEAGHPVRILWQQGNVSVALEGTALNDAALGEAIRVRMPERRSVLVGTVTAPGQATMP
jgi:flagella basal body P-ring formation protein FlgA